MLQHITYQDKQVCCTCYCDFLPSIKDDEHFTATTVISAKTIFHLSGNINEYNLSILRRNNLRRVTEHTRDSPKAEYICPYKECSGHFFAECTVTDIMY
jgi:hypothetical protein